jgi:beta-xylosidase
MTTRLNRAFTILAAVGVVALILLAYSSVSATAPTLAPGVTWTDEFDSPSLDPRWSWIREDPEHWDLSQRPGFLRIYSEAGSLYQTSNDGTNLLVRTAPIGDFEIETRVLFTPTSNIQTAGLLVYEDDDNYLALIRAYCGFIPQCKGNAIYFDQEEQGQTIGSNFVMTITTSSEAYLRVLRQGTVYTGYVSVDGLDWLTVGTHTVVSGLVPSQVGLYAYNGDFVAPEIPADFDYYWLDDRSYRVMMPLVTRQ